MPLKLPFFWTTFAALGLSFVYMLVSLPPQWRQKQNRVVSSVWCSRTDNFSRRCTFANLCFNKGFLLSISKKSSIVGLESKEDLKTIRASPVLNHTIGNLMLTVVKPSNPLLQYYDVIQKPVYLMHRFKPDNLFHILHDDLLPLYFAYDELCQGDIEECVQTHLVGFIDSSPLELNLEWYRLFSSKPPFKTIQEKNSTVCFRTAHVWSITETSFFKYGFKSRQGPLSPKVSANFFYRFSNFILDAANVQRKKKTKALILLREKTRLVVNKEELIEVIDEVLTAKLNTTILKSTIDISGQSMKTLLTEAASSKFLIGIHGSGMALSLFLPSDSIVIELFPYGINPTHVSPIKSLSTVEGSYFKYYSWVNKNEKNTKGHPEYPVLFGGSPQRKTHNCTNLPAVSCCHDPKYLYCMYQDTIVDSSFESLLWQIQLKSRKEGDLIYKKWTYPGPVLDMKCACMEGFLKMRWLHPMNHDPSMDYNAEIVFNGKKSLFDTFSTEHTLYLGLLGCDARVWTVSKSVITGESLPVYAQCTVYTESW